VMAFGDRLATEYSHALDDRGRDYVRRMQDASTRMLALINDLLRYARVTSEARPFEATDLNLVTEQVVSDLDERVRREQGRVEIAPLPVIEADPMQMHQLFLNLIGNGLKFHAQERLPLVIVHSEDGEDGEVVIVVADNGIGFNDKYVERMFQPFRRLHGKGVFEGTGMGLAICAKIAIRHGGRIDASGTPGEGSTFRVTLPRVRPVIADQPRP